MGYLNQVLKYGEDKFCQKVVDCGIDTLILPDLPMVEYENHYQKLFEKRFSQKTTFWHHFRDFWPRRREFGLFLDSKRLCRDRFFMFFEGFCEFGLGL